ncbi:hypothetical protein JCM11491_003041 [Sporobolomyces phaffii]
MEKYSKWRDPSTGVAPFLYPLSPASTDAALPPVLRVVTVPCSAVIGAFRSLLVALLLLAQAILVDGVLSVFLLYPPLHYVLSRTCNSAISRVILFVLGVAIISVETIRLAKTGRSPPQVAFEPRQGDLIVSNSSSYVDLLYLSFRHNATFLAPVFSADFKVTGWKRASLVRAVWENGRIPGRTTGDKGETLEGALKNSHGPAVLFPECTTSNNRAVLKFPSLSNQALAKLSSATKIFVLAFKYPAPTRLTPSLTHPIPSHSPFLGPIPHLYSMTSSLSLHTLSVRRLHPSESPRKLEWEGLEELVAATGRFKRLGGLGSKEKEAFLEFRRLKGR